MGKAGRCAMTTKPFADPEFLQNLGRVTISFALLDGTLTAVLAFLSESKDIEAVADMRFSDKVKEFLKLAPARLKELGSVTFDRAFFEGLATDLNDVADRRNSLMHCFWTFDPSTATMFLRTMKKRKRVPDEHPTPAKLLRLSDRIYEVGKRIGPVSNEYSALLHEKARSRPAPPDLRKG
jgi:hypothetical protein